VTVRLSARDRAKIGEANLANVAAEEIARRQREDDQPYEVRRGDILDRAVRLAADLEELLDLRPSYVERLQVQQAQADGYTLRKKLEAIRGIEWKIKAL